MTRMPFTIPKIPITMTSVVGTRIELHSGWATIAIPARIPITPAKTFQSQPDRSEIRPIRPRIPVMSQ